ncbi:MAG TPA: mechanosensitive ion channel family protein [Candidatus Binatia bacterium]|nr:mechanosensitive ion channel family protein [Candidatus Binatia bacterium]
MSGWERLQQIHGSGLELLVGILALAVVLLLRWAVLPPDRRRGTTAPAVFLAIALVLHLLASVMAAELGTPSGALALLTILFLALGLTGLCAIVVFDFALRRRQIPSILRDLAQAVMLFGIVLVVLRSSGVDPFSLLTTSAVVTAVVGLALQNTIANVFAGLALPIERTIQIGDWVKVGDHVGRIVELEWRAALLVTKDGDSVIVPNAQLLGSEVVNYSRPNDAHRMWLRVGFHYRHPPNEVRRVLLGALRGAPDVLEVPAPDCFPVEFGDSAIVYALRYWIADFERESPIDGEVRTRVWYAAQRAGLEMPFPIRTIVAAGPAVEHHPAQRESELAERLDALAGVDVFAPLEDADRELLARGMKRVHFGAGERIIEQGDFGDSLYLIRSGEIAVHLALDGVRRQVARLDAGDFFGEMSLITGEPRNASCTAVSDAVCYVIDHRTFRSLLDAKPDLARDLSAVLARRQMALDGEREGLSAEARARREAETQSNLLDRIRGFFGLG